MESSSLVINRASDFRRALLVNLKVENESLTLQNAGGIAKGTAYLPCVDSEQRDFVWQRVVVEVGDFEGFVRISAFAANVNLLPGSARPFDAYLTDEAIPLAEKTALLDPLFAKSFVGGKDVLLGVRGRYLWLKIELILTGNTAPVLSKVTYTLQADHMLDHLPAVYTQYDDGFLYRYLSLFNSMVEDLEKRIENKAEALDYQKATGGLLRFLASWVCVDDDTLTDEALREVIRGAVSEYEMAQTPEGILRLVERWTGHRPVLVEQFEIEPMMRKGKDRELYQKLFGNKENCFYVLLPQECFETAEQSQAFLQKLRRRIPAHVEAELILLKDSLHLDMHSYVGVNAVIASHTEAAIHQRVAIQYDTVIGGELA